MRPDLLAGLASFQVVAVERSFTRAGTKLGVTQSALSQTIRRLEDSVGVKLLARTTRSVTPTVAGERLLATLGPAITDIASELESLAAFRDRPIGSIRVTAGQHAAETVLWPAVSALVRAYPELEVETDVNSAYVDIVAERFDAGIRLGERVEKDMVAVPVGPPLRSAVVASPHYLAEHGSPAEPVELSRHRCIRFRSSNGSVYAWEFARGGRDMTIKVGGGPIFNDGRLIVAAAKEGLGLAHLMEDMVEPELADGSLVRVLEDWCEPFAGYHLYYPSRRQPTHAFTLFLEAIRR